MGFLLACVSHPNNSKEVVAKTGNLPLKGFAVGPPESGNGDKRLFLHLQTDKGILTAVAVNSKKKEILRDISRRILAMPSDKPIFLYGQPMKGRWEEFSTGIDYEIYAIGVYVVPKEGYFIILTGYGDSWKDHVNTKDLGKFILKEGWGLVK